MVAKFCAKYLHQQVLKSEAYTAGDIGTSLQNAFFRLDEKTVLVLFNDFQVVPVFFMPQVHDRAIVHDCMLFSLGILLKLLF